MVSASTDWEQQDKLSPIWGGGQGNSPWGAQFRGRPGPGENPATGDHGPEVTVRAPASAPRRGEERARRDRTRMAALR